MSENHVILENLSQVSQQVFDEDNVIHSLPALARFPFPESIADKFLTERGEFVRIYSPSVIPKQKSVDEPMMWIANVTGDPDAPETVELEDQTRQGPVKRQYNHSCHRERPIEYKMHVDQKVVKDASGLPFALNLPPVKIRLLPMDVVQVPYHVGQFVLGRASSLLAVDEKLGAPVREIRRPGDFQPNQTWTIADIWLYMQLMAPDKFTVNREKTICQKVAHNALTTFEKVLKEAPNKANELKKEVWKHAFFTLIDKQYALIPKEYFKKAKTEANSKLAKAENAAEEENLVSRGPGRPRKS